MGKSSGSGPNKHTKLDERSNVMYFSKLLKKSKSSARSEVSRELNLMLSFLMKKLTEDMTSIVTNYTKKEGTIRPKLVQSALQVMLAGELRTDACDAGAATLQAFMNSTKVKKGKSAEVSVE